MKEVRAFLQELSQQCALWDVRVLQGVEPRYEEEMGNDEVGVRVDLKVSTQGIAIVAAAVRRHILSVGCRVMDMPPDMTNKISVNAPRQPLPATLPDIE